MFKDEHSQAQVELNKQFNIIPREGTFTVAEEFQDKKAFIIKYNRNKNTLTDKNPVKASTSMFASKEDRLANARSAGLKAVEEGLIPANSRFEVDYEGCDYGEYLGPKTYSRASESKYNYDQYKVDETYKEFTELPKGEKAYLKAIGKYCNVWYYNNNNLADEVLRNAIAEGKTSFQEVADNFDKFYEYETFIFGSNVPTKHYSYLEEFDRGIKVDIFIYDVDELYTKKMTGGVFGYFHGKDLYTKRYNPNSNACEVIYIDSAFLGLNPKYMYSTLAHEFQHLLLNINKFINKGLDFNSWFTEMMSLAAEDALQNACLGYENNEGISNRVYEFNGGYNAGFVNWGGMNKSVYYSYATAAIFMDYLMKNYGGINLLYEIAHNDYMNEEAVTKALQKLGYDETFDSVMMKMGIMIINSYDNNPNVSDPNYLTINKNCSYPITINGKVVNFKFNALNLCNYQFDNTTGNYKANDRYLSASRLFNDGKDEFITGPSVLKSDASFKNIYSKAITVNHLITYPKTITVDEYDNNNFSNYISRNLRYEGIATEVYNNIIDALENQCFILDGTFLQISDINTESSANIKYNKNNFCLTANENFIDIQKIYNVAIRYNTINKLQKDSTSNIYTQKPITNNLNNISLMELATQNIFQQNFSLQQDIIQENICPEKYETQVDTQSWGICSCFANGKRRSNNGTSPRCVATYPVKPLSYEYDTDNNLFVAANGTDNSCVVKNGNTSFFFIPWGMELSTNTSEPTAQDWCTLEINKNNVVCPIWAEIETNNVIDSNGTNRKGECKVPYCTNQEKVTSNNCTKDYTYEYSCPADKPYMYKDDNNLVCVDDNMSPSVPAIKFNQTK